MISYLLLLALAMPLHAETVTVDFTSSWDLETPLANPHKGWYHHYYDNGLHKYLIRNDDEILNFPGMDHLYLRLAWSYLEPDEGRFTWEVLDDMVEKWVPEGYGISLRISCRETGTRPIQQKFATPQWVTRAGAKGMHVARGQKPGNPAHPWEPKYDDRVYLEKVEHFIRALAARYDGKPWLRYVDVGSIGDWGEGHTTSGSNTKIGWEARLEHLKIHRRHFTKTLIMVSDDFVYAAPTQEGRERLHRYMVENGMSYRDDSILVDYYIKAYGATHTVRTPLYFKDVYRRQPTVLELQHYGPIKHKANWMGKPGSTIESLYHSNGPAFLRKAIEHLHATYIGYHGYIHEWIAENPELTGELLNRCGYWYVPHRASYPPAVLRGEAITLAMDWENRGVAPAYHEFELRLHLSGPSHQIITVPAGNRAWMPGKVQTTRYRLELPSDLVPGAYTLSFSLHSPDAGREVLVGLGQHAHSPNSTYLLGPINVKGR